MFSAYSCHIKVFVLTLNLNTGNNTDCVGVCNREHKNLSVCSVNDRMCGRLNFYVKDMFYILYLLFHSVGDFFFYHKNI